jgi:hypothetical protein
MMCRQGEKINTSLRERASLWRMDSSGPGRGPVVGFVNTVDVPSGYMKCGELAEKLNDYQLLEDYSVTHRKKFYNKNF